MKTIINDSGAWIGYREIFFRNNTHVFVKITEMYPYNGRTWCRFYNDGDWYVDWTVSAIKEDIDIITTTEEYTLSDGLKIRHRNGVVELSNSKWTSISTTSLLIPEKYRADNDICISALYADNNSKVYPSRVTIDMTTGRLIIEFYSSIGGTSTVATTGMFVGLNASWII